MRRLVLVVAVLLLLSGCSAVQRKEQSTAPVVGELRRPGGQTGQLSSGAPQPSESNSTPATQPTLTSPSPPPTPSTPAPAPAESAQPPVESACTYPSAQTLAAKGKVLVQDGQTSIYKYAWGADCTFRQPVAAWVVQDGNVSPFLIDKREINSVRKIILSNDEHAYLVAGEGVGAAARAYYLVVVRYGDPRLFRFPREMRLREEGVPSTMEPEVTGDMLKTVERVGVGETMRYITRTYQLDPHGLTAKLISEETGYPVNRP